MKPVEEAKMCKPVGIAICISLLLSLIACGPPTAPQTETLTLSITQSARFTEEQPGITGSGSTETVFAAGGEGRL